MQVPERQSLIKTVMIVEDMTVEEATLEVAKCRQEARDMIDNGEDPSDILEDWFGIEPDWLDELIFM